VDPPVPTEEYSKNPRADKAGVRAERRSAQFSVAPARRLQEYDGFNSARE
jgi:hypothetical protein